MHQITRITNVLKQQTNNKNDVNSNLVELTQLTVKLTPTIEQLLITNGTLKIVLNLIATHPTNNQQIAQNSFSVLRNVCVSEKISKEFMINKGFDLLLITFRNYLHDEKVTERQLELLINTTRDALSAKQFLLCGLTRSVLTSLRYYSDSQQIQQLGIMLITLLSTSEGLAQELILEGAHYVLLKQFHDCIERPKRMDRFLSAFFNLTNSSVTRSIIIGQTNLIQLLVDQLKERMEDETFVQKSFSLFANLACTERNILSFLKLDLLNSSLDIISVSYRNTELCLRVTLFLYNMSCSAVVRNEIKTIKNSMFVLAKVLKDKLQYQQAVELILSLLLNVSAKKSNQIQLVKHGVINSILSAIVTYQTDNKLKNVALQTLSNLSFLKVARNQIAKGGGTNLILNILKNNLNDTQTVNSSVSVLMNLSNLEINRKILNYNGTNNLLTIIITKYQNNPEILHSAKSTLKNLGY
ncbi:hypothetical protein M0813_27516 [Anaeramoeba flamelloides]|uniref:Uncharacterized protein n=1 Tax=Anaeramoeba flamelloides TaxID=1746091 RepID=A0ABQ8XVZ0_9EUKA|nr:hypothetical protein M0813_27516 [Anaeramoeba flamelloides]